MNWRFRTLLLALALLMAFSTAFNHAVLLERIRPGYIAISQWAAHNAVLKGIAGNPRQYRVLPEYLAEGVRRLFSGFNEAPNDTVWGFVAFRMLIDTAVLLLAYAYYRQLGLTRVLAIVGMILLSRGVALATFDSNLSFDSFLELALYLAAAGAIAKGRYELVIPVTLIAALTRETSGLIPVMCLAALAWEVELRRRRTVILTGLASFAVYATAFFGLRAYYGPQGFDSGYGHMPGWDLLSFNAQQLTTWVQLLAVLSVVPFLALYGYQTWPLRLKAIFFAVVPTWFVVHMFMAILAEARLLLVPLAVAFLPGALFLAQRLLASSLRPARTGSNTARKSPSST